MIFMTRFHSNLRLTPRGCIAIHRYQNACA